MHNAVLQERMLDCLNYEEDDRDIISMILEVALERSKSKMLNLAVEQLCKKVENLQMQIKFERAMRGENKNE